MTFARRLVGAWVPLLAFILATGCGAPRPKAPDAGPDAGPAAGCHGSGNVSARFQGVDYQSDACWVAGGSATQGGGIASANASGPEPWLALSVTFLATNAITGIGCSQQSGQTYGMNDGCIQISVSALGSGNTSWAAVAGQPDRVMQANPTAPAPTGFLNLTQWATLLGQTLAIGFSADATVLVDPQTTGGAAVLIPISGSASVATTR